MAAGACLTNKSGLSEFDGLDSVDILARLIYSEAEGESLKGKRGVYHVVVNRKAKNSSEFGGDTIAGVALKSGAFEGMTTSRARCPKIESKAWKDSLDIAKNGGDNPIGKCLWFNANDTYKAKSKTENKVEKYSFNGKDYREVVEKVVIGGHTFFRLSGY